MRLFVSIATWIIATLFLVGCGSTVAPGNLVMDLDYPDSVDVTQQRQIEFVFIITNTGEKACKVQNIFSADFWKTDSPGLTGNVNEVFDKVIEAGASEGVIIKAYIWDADTLRDSMKRFAFTANVEQNEDCPQAYVTEEGLLWLYK